MASSCCTGSGRCINCHTGFAFTDHGFYDIGLPSEDLGRGPIVNIPAADYAFKVPSLRELAWTAPYSHDGSIGTLDDIIRIYEMGGIERPTRSRDLPQNLRITDDERNDLIAFLLSLSSDTPPKPSTEPWVGNTVSPRPPCPPTPPWSARSTSSSPLARAPRRRSDFDRPQRRHPHPQRAHL